MWLLRYLFFSVVLGIFAIIVLLFLGQNQHIEQLDFFGVIYTTNLVWVVLGTAAFGIFITLLLLLPGRVGVALHNRTLERELRNAEHDLARLHEQRERLLARHEWLLDTHEHMLQSHQRLMAEHTRVIAERDRARTQLAATGTAGTSGTIPATVTARQHTSAPRLAIVPPAATDKQLSEEDRTPDAAPLRRATPAPAREQPSPRLAQVAPPLPLEPLLPVSSSSTPDTSVSADTSVDTSPPLPRALSAPSAPGSSFAQQVAALPDLLRSRVREDVAELSALAASVRAALEARLTRLERTHPLSHPLSGVSSGDDQG